MSEAGRKIRAVREHLTHSGADALRLKGVDWFAWATGGGDSCVIFSAEAGIAEVYISQKGAFVLTSVIEGARLAQEQLPPDYELITFPWQDPAAFDKFIREQGDVTVLSDRPSAGEAPLKSEWLDLKWHLGPEEIARYRALGRDAATAAREALDEARTGMTEFELAGLAANALWRRGIHPLLTLVGGERRLAAHRHPVASEEKLAGRAMLVICGRRHGLFANLTRHLFFRDPTHEELRRAEEVALVEAAAFSASREGAELKEVYGAIADRYASLGHAEEISRHHQGGPTGYLSREAIALPGRLGHGRIRANMALAWNPSLPGAKIEDTVLLGKMGELEVLTLDEKWPAMKVEGRDRPGYLVRP
jgi:hypothetical protein